MKKINAVEMVRRIRDRQYEETKGKTTGQLRQYFEDKSRWALAKGAQRKTASSR